MAQIGTVNVNLNNTQSTIQTQGSYPLGQLPAPVTSPKETSSLATIVTEGQDQHGNAKVNVTPTAPVVVSPQTGYAVTAQAALKPLLTPITIAPSSNTIAPKAYNYNVPIVSVHKLTTPVAPIQDSSTSLISKGEADTKINIQNLQ
jgi:hypothetical protein